MNAAPESTADSKCNAMRYSAMRHGYILVISRSNFLKIWSDRNLRSFPIIICGRLINR